MSAKPEKKGFGTLCVESPAGRPLKDIRPHREPIYPTTAFTYASAEKAMEQFQAPHEGYIYSRWANPTAEAAANKIAQLEHFGSGGLSPDALLFSSGMAAISAVMMACLQPGDIILTQPQLYGGTEELLNNLLKKWNIRRIKANLNHSDLVGSLLQQHPDIRLIYVETPSNPMLQCYDLQSLAELIQSSDVKLAVDNTFSTPYVQQPLRWGADIAIHSTTKFLNGHGNALGGAVVSPDHKWVRGPLWEQLKLLGASCSPFDAWLLLNGLKTLAVRMERHCENAFRLADFLRHHPAVAKVYYCGFDDHPDRAVIAQQMNNGGAMLSFELKGGLEAGIRCMNKVKICTLATTLGTIDTLIQHPASMTHAGIPAEDRQAMGISDGLVRLSAGLENIEDLKADLDQALRG